MDLSQEVAAYLEVFALREELIARLAILEGLRPGEILALRWKALALFRWRSGSTNAS
jgi:integrase